MSAFVVEDQERQREMNKNDRWKVPKMILGGVQSVRTAFLSTEKQTMLESRAAGGLGHTSLRATKSSSPCRAHEHLGQDCARFVINLWIVTTRVSHLPSRESVCSKPTDVFWNWNSWENEFETLEIEMA